MRVTTQPTPTGSFVSEYWSAESGAVVVAYLRKQLAAASGVFPELRNYEIYPLAVPDKGKPK